MKPGRRKGRQWGRRGAGRGAPSRGGGRRWEEGKEEGKEGGGWAPGSTGGGGGGGERGSGGGGRAADPRGRAGGGPGRGRGASQRRAGAGGREAAGRLPARWGEGRPRRAGWPCWGSPAGEGERVLRSGFAGRGGGSRFLPARGDPLLGASLTGCPIVTLTSTPGRAPVSSSPAAAARRPGVALPTAALAPTLSPRSLISPGKAGVLRGGVGGVARGLG